MATVAEVQYVAVACKRGEYQKWWDALHRAVEDELATPAVPDCLRELLLFPRGPEQGPHESSPVGRGEMLHAYVYASALHGWTKDGDHPVKFKKVTCRHE